MKHDRTYTPRGGPLALVGALCMVFLSGCVQPSPSAVQGQVRLSGHQTESPVQEADLPPSARTLKAMADILATQGKDAECEFVLRRCMQQYPRFTPAHNTLAELLMRQGRLHQAAAVLAQALAVFPQDPVLLNNLGMCHLLQREYEKSLACFTQAAGIVPEREKYRANMATALGLLGRHEESLALWQQILPQEEARRNVNVLRETANSRTL